MKRKKLVSLLLAGTMVASLAACGNNSGSGSSNSSSTGSSTTTTDSNSKDTASEGGSSDNNSSAAAVDTSERVDLVFYVMGDAPADEEAVENAINEKLLEKVNATVDFQFSTWTDFQTKYSLELTSGTADLIYVANWLNFGQLAKSGAFLELNDMLDTVAPDLKETVGESGLNMCSVDGDIYAIPNTWAEYVSPGIKYREDLRQKYDLPVPNTIENVEAYFAGIKAADPSQGILTVTAEESQGLDVAFDAAWILTMKYPWVTVKGIPYGLASNYDTPDDVYDYWFSDDFVEDAKMFKSWADQGFWSRSALSDTNNSESYKLGLCVAEIAGQNPNKQITAIQDFEDAGEGWVSEYVAYVETTGVIFPGHATQNATSIVRGCKNPERALMVLEQLLCDEELNRLVQAGIEGTHYEINSDGFYENLSTDFPYEGFNSWDLRNGDYKLMQPTDVKLQAMFDKYNEIGSKTKFPNTDIYSGFTEDYESYSAERTAVSNVMRQYLAPIQAGLVDDVDAAVAEFRDKVQAAGLDACREGFEKQWHEYCEAYGYK